MIKYVVTKENIELFKEAVDILLEKGPHKIDTGLCYEIAKITKKLGSSYEIMHTVLTELEYEFGIGPAGVLTEDRITFLMLLQAMQVEDFELLAEYSMNYS